jgi:hypothetical protein
MNVPQVFLDANLLFTAAHNPLGKAALLIELGHARVFRLLTSAYAAEEARRNIARKYPECSDPLEILLSGLRVVPDAPDISCPALLSEKDWPIFRAARGCGADVLLTGDIKDFGFLMNAPDKAEGLLIQTVAEFLSAERTP